MPESAGPDGNVIRVTKFDADFLQPADGSEDLFGLSTTRQIARAADGSWLVLLKRGKEFVLRVCRRQRPRGQDFDAELLLVGPDQPAVFENRTRARGAAAIHVDPKGLLHLFWQEGRKVHHETYGESDLSVLRRLRDVKRWKRLSIALDKVKSPVLCDAVIDRAGRAWVACAAEDGVYVGSPGRGRRFVRAAPGGRGARLALAPDGQLHLAFEWERPVHERDAKCPWVEACIYHLTSADGQTWLNLATGGEDPDVAAHAIASCPSMVTWRGYPLVAYRVDAVKEVRTRDYLKAREGGGASIGYAFHDGVTWRRGYVARAREILIKKIDPVEPAGRYKGKVYPMVEQMGPPSLVLDGHGVPWVFWMERTRRYSFRARWLGEEFGAPQEHYGPFYAPGEFVAADDSAAAGPPDVERQHVGMVAIAAGRVYFDTAAVPSLSAAEERTVPFLDLLEVAEMRGLAHRVNPMTKFDGNPVFEGGPPGAWDHPHVSAPRVEYDASRKVFRMFYSGSSGEGWSPGYAESEDGVKWQRVNTGVVEADGGLANNRLHQVVWYRDPEETHPERRYKGFLFRDGGHASEGFVTSPDAIHWTTDENVPVERTQLPFTEPFGISYRDVTPLGDGRFTSIGRTWHDCGRAVGMVSSEDLFAWRGSEHVLDPDAPFKKPPSRPYGACVMESNVGPPWEDQIYYAFCEGPVHGLYLLFYAPCDFDCRYCLALAVSRDGRHFTRVCGGEPILPTGAAGEWDNGFILASHASGPLPAVGDEVRIYYGASGWHHGTDPHRPRMKIGFASQLRDRWACLRPEPGADQGSLATIPIDLRAAGARELRVNVDGLAGRGRVIVEALDPDTFEPIPRCSGDHCIPLAEDGLDVPVRWRGTRVLTQIKQKRIRLRFHIQGVRTRLFGFRFGGE